MTVTPWLLTTPTADMIENTSIDMFHVLNNAHHVQCFISNYLGHQASIISDYRPMTDISRMGPRVSF